LNRLAGRKALGQPVQLGLKLLQLVCLNLKPRVHVLQPLQAPNNHHTRPGQQSSGEEQPPKLYEFLQSAEQKDA